MKKRIQVQGMLVVFSCLITVILSQTVFPPWKKGLLDDLSDSLGILLVLSGFLVRISARGYKEENSSQGVALVKDGPYSLVRNPMYFGTLLIGSGVITILFELWTFPLFLFIFLMIYIPQIKKEESLLSERFGQEYKDYCRVTPRCFPGFHSLLNIREKVPLKWPWVKKELLSFIAVVVLILALEMWEEVRLFGIKDFLNEQIEILLIIILFALMVLFLRKREGS